MDQRKPFRNNHYGTQTEERSVPVISRAVNREAWPGAAPLPPLPRPEDRRIPVVSRSINQEAWPGTSPLPPMATPAAGSKFVGRPGPNPLAESLLRSRREMRMRRDRALLLCGLAVVILCASFIALLASKLRPTSQAGVPPAITTQQAPQNAAAAPILPAGKTKILLLGSDQRPEDSGYRTDVIILLTLDSKTMTVSAVSFPRDLWVKVPSLYEMKINQVFALGGFDAMAEMFKANFGVTPDYYVKTNFAGFTQFVDQQGGVDVAVEQELTDDCDLPQAQNGDCTVTPGVVHMDGATALWYVRSRATSSDFDRLRRAQEVLYGLFNKMVNLGTLSKLNEIKASLQDNVETNMSVEKAISFLPFASRVIQYPEKIERFAITEDQATPSWSWNGMWILLPDPEAIQALLKQAGVKP
jgi:polyisoprenyl-teichoic acid--peptidoglycan teichoic acid transferase